MLASFEINTQKSPVSPQINCDYLEDKHGKNNTLTVAIKKPKLSRI